MLKKPFVLTLFFFLLIISISYFALSNPKLDLPHVELPKRHSSPLIACTKEELERLQLAYNNQEGKPVKSLVNRAKTYLNEKIVIPPDGGQHQTLYQCRKCESALQYQNNQHTCPHCKRKFSGIDYDRVIYGRQHNRIGRKMLDLSWAYVITKNEEFAQSVIDLLIQYSNSYQSYPIRGHSRFHFIWNWISGGRLFSQTLSEATFCAQFLAPSYDLVYSSKYLTQDKHQKVQENLFKPLLKSIDRFHAGKNNWQSWHNAALLWGGVVLNDPQWVSKAIYEGYQSPGTFRLMTKITHWWNQEPSTGNGFLYQLKASLNDDGIWYENSWGYHFYALQALSLTAEGARRIGIPLWEIESLKKMFLTPAQFTMPDGYLPRFGDDVHTKITTYQQLYESAYFHFKDKRLLPYLSQQNNWNSILYGREIKHDLIEETQSSKMKSADFPSTGQIILRSEGKAGITLAIPYGKHGGFHSHFDRLSFVMFAYKKEVALDSGRAKVQAYSLPIHKHWYRNTISHNAILVDGKQQKATSASLIYKHLSDNLNIAVFDGSTLFKGVHYIRTFITSGSFVIVIDQLKGHQTHQYDLVYHSPAKRFASHEKLKPSSISNLRSGAKYLKNIYHLSNSNYAQVISEDQQVHQNIIFINENKFDLYTAMGPFTSIHDLKPMLVIRQKGKSTSFVTLLEPYLANEKQKGKPTISITEGILNITPSHGQKQYRINLNQGIVKYPSITIE